MVYSTMVFLMLSGVSLAIRRLPQVADECRIAFISPATYTTAAGYKLTTEFKMEPYLREDTFPLKPVCADGIESAKVAACDLDVTPELSINEHDEAYVRRLGDMKGLGTFTADLICTDKK